MEEEEVHKREQAAAVNDKKQRRGTTGKLKWFGDLVVMAHIHFSLNCIF